MTKLLEQAIEALNRLPAESQDLYATEILADLHGDAVWEEKFAQTTEEQWAKIDDRFQAERQSGEPIPLSDFLKQHDVESQ